jgi:hypothetical protein
MGKLKYSWKEYMKIKAGPKVMFNTVIRVRRHQKNYMHYQPRWMYSWIGSTNEIIINKTVKPSKMHSMPKPEMESIGSGIP